MTDIGKMQSSTKSSEIFPAPLQILWGLGVSAPPNQTETPGKRCPQQRMAAGHQGGRLPPPPTVIGFC